MSDRPGLRICYWGFWTLLLLTAASLSYEHIRRGDFAALAGAVGIQLAAFLAFGCYGAIDLRLRRARTADWGQFLIWRRECLWFLWSAGAVLPGVWIGSIAWHSWLAVVCDFLFFTGISHLGYAADRILDPATPPRSPLKLENEAINAALIAAGALIGVALRSLSHQ